LPRPIAALRQRYPGVVIEVRQATPSTIIELVRAGELDVGLSLGVPSKEFRLVAFPLMTVPRILLVQHGHPLLRKDQVSLEDLLQYPMICQNGLSTGGWEVAQVFREHGM